MAVGLPLKTTYANGDVYSASDVNDTNGTINLTAAPYAAGKNKFINGAFDNWQRGTSISLTSGVFAYTVDRFLASCSFSAGSSTVSRQAFTPGTAPVSGYEGNYFARLTCGSTTSVWNYRQNIENVTTFAGQTATISFWIKASAANATTSIEVAQIFGSGGSGNVVATYTGPSVTTAWQRFSLTVNIPSIAGKTIGTSSYLSITLYSTTGIASSLLVDTWGWQMEAGSTATAFQTATGTIQGELAACQRYYYRQTVSTNYGYLAFGMCNNSTSAKIQIPLPVPLRVVPTSLDSPTASTLRVTDGTTGTTLNGTPTLDSDTSNSSITFNVGVASGLTQYRAIWFGANNSSSAYIGFSAEL